MALVTTIEMKLLLSQLDSGTQESQSESKCESVNFIENSGLSNNMGIQLQAANLMETLWFRGKDDTNLPQHPGKVNSVQEACAKCFGVHIP